MRVQVHVKGLPGSSKLRRYATRKLDAALARFAPSIQDASVRLSDINGPQRGGVDKLCRVVVTLKNNSVVVIEDLGSDIAQVIERTSDRVQQSISRQLSRLINVDRNGLRQSSLALATV